MLLQIEHFVAQAMHKKPTTSLRFWGMFFGLRGRTGLVHSVSLHSGSRHTRQVLHVGLLQGGLPQLMQWTFIRLPFFMRLRFLIILFQKCAAFIGFGPQTVHSRALLFSPVHFLHRRRSPGSIIERYTAAVHSSSAAFSTYCCQGPICLQVSHCQSMFLSFRSLALPAAASVR